MSKNHRPCGKCGKMVSKYDGRYYSDFPDFPEITKDESGEAFICNKCLEEAGKTTKTTIAIGCCIFIVIALIVLVIILRVYY